MKTNTLPALVEAAKSADGYLASQGYSIEHKQRKKLLMALNSCEEIEL